MKRGVCMVGIIFPCAGSPALRQMENRKGEQGEIQLSQVFCSSSVPISVCVSVCVFSLSVRSSSQAPLTLSGTDSSKTKELSVCWPETTGVCLCTDTCIYCMCVCV